MNYDLVIKWRDFPGGPVVKNLPSNTGDVGSIPGWEDLLENGIATHSSILGAILVIHQMVKNLPTMGENWVLSLSPEDPLEKGTATNSSILAWRLSI